MKSVNAISDRHNISPLSAIAKMLINTAIVLLAAFMLVFPGASFQGAASGLLLWFHNVVPSILPFVIISNLMVRMNIAGSISRLFHPILGRLLHISREGCYPVILGFLSGLPVGAKSTADLVAAKQVSLPEGQFLLGMCNNASPMFIIGYIAIAQLKLPGIKYALFVIIYGSSIIGAVLFRSFVRRKSDITHWHAMNEASAIITDSNHFSMKLLDQAIMNGFEIITRIGGYIILFSIIAQIIMEIGPKGSFIKILLTGILEITTGISQICISSLDVKIKIVLICVMTSFGGLSAIAQTKSVIGDTRLSMKSYTVIKLLSAASALVLSIVYVTLFPIGWKDH